MLLFCRLSSDLYKNNLKQYLENKYVVESTGFKPLAELINGRAAMLGESQGWFQACPPSRLQHYDRSEWACIPLLDSVPGALAAKLWDMGKTTAHLPGTHVAHPVKQ